MMQMAIRDKRCPEAHCLKQPTRAVSVLRFSELFCFYSELFCSAPELFPSCFLYVAHPLGCN